MNFFYTSIILSVLIGIMIIAKIRSYDIYEKEAFISMFVAFITGGAFSVIIALLLYRVIERFGVSDAAISTIPGSFLIIGPIEELSKFAGLIVVYLLLKKEFSEVTDGVIYMSCVALGFSVIENFLYANSGENNQHLILFRTLISTPAHISCSCIMGYAFYRHKKENKSLVAVLLALIIASVFHGIFDAVALSPWISYFLIVYLWAIMHQTLRIVQYSNIRSPYRPSFEKLFKVPETGEAEEMTCPYCKTNNHKAMIRNDYFTAFRCDDCGYYSSPLRHLIRIFRVFAPEYKRFKKKIMPVKLGDNKVYSSVYGSAFFEDGAEMGFYRVHDLDATLHLINVTIIDSIRRTSLIPKKILEKIID